MKTTVQIPDSLFDEVQGLAQKEGTTPKALVQEGLRLVVETRKKKITPFRLRDASFNGGDGLTPEFQNASWEQIRDLLYEGRGA